MTYSLHININLCSGHLARYQKDLRSGVFHPLRTKLPSCAPVPRSPPRLASYREEINHATHRLPSCSSVGHRLQSRTTVSHRSSSHLPHNALAHWLPAAQRSRSCSTAWSHATQRSLSPLAVLPLACLAARQFAVVRDSISRHCTLVRSPGCTPICSPRARAWMKTRRPP